MAEKATSIWTRLMAFVAAILSGLIFIFGSLRAVFFGQSFIEYLMVDLGLAQSTAEAFNILMMVACYAGWIILGAAVMIIIGRKRIAKYILLIVIGTGLLSFLVPVIAALAQGTLSMEVLLNGDATMYLVAVLFGMIAKLQVDKM